MITTSVALLRFGNVFQKSTKDAQQIFKYLSSPICRNGWGFHQATLSLACHFEGFWGQFPKWERFTSVAFRVAIWLAGILFGIGITVWIVEMLAELCR
jgi:hypothetical protein